jgi:hypothetical protein
MGRNAQGTKSIESRGSECKGYQVASNAESQDVSGEGENQYTSKLALADAINAGHTRLIDAEFFVNQDKQEGGRLLSRQEMEQCFTEFLIEKIDPGDIFTLRYDPRFSGLVNMTGKGTWMIIAVSYPWLGRAPLLSNTQTAIVRGKSS